MRVGALDHLAAHLEHQAQHAVRRRMLRAEVDGVVADLGFGRRHLLAFSSPGNMPSHGLRKSKLRKSWISFTGS